jgi:hypothetical protein
VKTKNATTGISAARLVASIIGALAGLGGMTHGIGEILQGNAAPDGLVINSWTQGPIATNLGGEPGMTIVPNLLVTGMLTVLVSLAVIIWAAAFVQRKHGGWILMLLSVAMLLVGGGFAPPIIGVLAGVAGTRISATASGWRPHLSRNTRRFFARLWPWVFAVCVANGIFLVIGSVFLAHFFKLNKPDLFVYNFFFAILSVLSSILVGIPYDFEAQHGEEPQR